jgi:hypothetical protein
MKPGDFAAVPGRTRPDGYILPAKEGLTMKRTILCLLAVAAAAQQRATVAIDPDDMGGTVDNGKAPEAGVWVIAETTDLPTRFARIVVTDDRGRFLLPDLPKANYRVWVRGYGLVDSPKVDAAPGRTLNLRAAVAPDAKAAAEYYPASYWYSLLEVPDKSEFPGHRPGRQRHLAERQEPGAVSPRDENR